MKKKESDLISIIIANYNGEDFLPTCLNSVIKSSYTNLEILLIDDGSNDNSLNILEDFKKRDKRVRVIKNKKNIGAAASRNVGIRQVKGDIVIFLDNDTEVELDWIDEMIRTLNSDETIGACQAKLLDFKKRSIIQNAGVLLWAQTGWGLPFWQWEKNGKEHSDTKEIIAISAALAVKKDVLEKVGGFDEDEAVVTEDLDFSWRIWLAGYRIVLAPFSCVYHWTKPVEMRANMNHNRKKIYYHLTKNSFISISANYELYNSLKYGFSSVVISLARGILVLIRRGDLSALSGTVTAYFWILFNIYNLLQKRRAVQNMRCVKDNQLFNRIIVQKSPLIAYNQYYKKTNLL